MSDKIIEELTDGEEFELTECEDRIRTNIEGFWDCLLSFSKIQQMRLWRKHYESFKNYCEQKWGVTDERIRQLTKAHEVKISLPPEFAKLITNERQARAVAKVPPADRTAVVAAAAENGDVTAAGIEAAATAQQKIPKQITYDECGEIIPDEAMPFWNRRQEVQDLMTAVSKLKSKIKEAKETEDLLYYRVGNGTIMELNNIYTRFSDAKPYAVCTTCMGYPSLQTNGCGTCGNRGLISKFQWDVQTAKEIKEIRLKAIAERNAHV